MSLESATRSLLLTLTKELSGRFECSELAPRERYHDGQLVSLSIVGPPLHGRRIDRVMDIDTIVVLKGPMTLKHYSIVQNIFSELQNYSSSDIDITYRIADGPLKPLPKKPVNIFFHVLLHTEESYRASPLILVKCSWQHEAQSILGREVSEIQTLPKPNLAQILSSPLGIDHCTNLIAEKGSSCLEWSEFYELEPKLIPSRIAFSERCEVIEICFYSVLRSASNALRFRLGSASDIGIGLADMVLFSNVFRELNLHGFPEICWEAKLAMRLGYWYPTVTQLHHYIEQSQEFLCELRNALLILSVRDPGIYPSIYSLPVSESAHIAGHGI